MRPLLPLLSIALLLLAFTGNAQSPPGINYQGVARNLDGKPLVLKDITIKINIVKSSETGDVEYAETHTLKTNSFGLFTLVIGTGIPAVGDFKFISWAVGNKWLRVEMDPDGGNSFQVMGAQQFMSVPYAFYAQYSGNTLTAGEGIAINNSVIQNTGDSDNNPSNELNTGLALTVDRKLRLTDAGGTKEVDLSPLVVNGTDVRQDLSLAANKLKITENINATEIDLIPYLDNTDSQALTFTGSTLSISGGNSVNLGALGVDAQNLSSTGSGTNRTITITNGTSTTIDVADNDNSTTNEIQDLALSGNTLSLSSDASTVNLAPYLDNTDNQNLSASATGTSRTIGISGGTGVTINVADDDNSISNELQALTYSSVSKNLTLSSGNTVNIPETQNLTQVLAQGNDAGAQKITNLAAPTANADATTKKYVDDADALLNSKIMTTYAFKSDFSYTNGTLLASSNVTLPFTGESFDDFNVMNSSTFTAQENGIYVFTVDGSYAATVAGGQLSLLVNATKYPIAIMQPWGGLIGRYNATLMFRLTAGQTVSLIGDNVLVGGTFNGTFFGYKL